MPFLLRKKCCCQSCPSEIQVTFAGVDATWCSACVNYFTIENFTGIDGAHTYSLLGSDEVLGYTRCVYGENSIATAEFHQHLSPSCGSSFTSSVKGLPLIVWLNNSRVLLVQVNNPVSSQFAFRARNVSDLSAGVGDIGDTIDNMLATEPTFNGGTDSGSGCLLEPGGSRAHIASGGTVLIERVV